MMWMKLKRHSHKDDDDVVVDDDDDDTISHLYS